MRKDHGMLRMQCVCDNCGKVSEHGLISPMIEAIGDRDMDLKTEAGKAVSLVPRRNRVGIVVTGRKEDEPAELCPTCVGPFLAMFGLEFVGSHGVDGTIFK
jgi:hypothetical protein